MRDCALRVRRVVTVRGWRIYISVRHVSNRGRAHDGRRHALFEETRLILRLESDLNNNLGMIAWR